MATVALSGIITPSNVVTATSTETLTNKTLTSPILTTPNLGTPSVAVLTSATGLPLSTGVTGTLPIANGGTGQTALSAVTVGTATNLAGGSNGTIPYQSASGTTQMLAVGTSGQVLQTNGAGAPSWVTPGGGSWVYITTVTASAASTVDVESSFDSTYDMYVIVAEKIRGSTSSRVFITLKVGGSYATDYSYSATQFFSDAVQSTGYNQNDTAIRTSPAASLSGSSSFLSSLILYIPNPSGTATFKTVFGQLSGINDSQVNSNAMFSGNHTSAGSAGALTGVRFAASTGTLYGVFRLYGIKNS